MILGFMEGSPIVNKTRAAENFIRRHRQLFIISDIEERRACTMDYKILIGDEEFVQEWSSFQQDLCDDPQVSINCLGLAIHQVSSLYHRYHYHYILIR